MTQIEPDDREPDGKEAEAQREETVMPFIWGGVAILIIAVFVALAIFAPSQPGKAPRPSLAPVIKPMSSPDR
ncbi:MAG: hypothetical protein ACHP7N_11875 [Caulobacterales bacterium]